MEKLYDRINWHNDTTPALNESNLNRMDRALDEIDDRVVELSGTITEDVPAIKEYLDQADDLVERIETMTKNPPYIGANGNWYVFNTNTMQYEDSGIDASITVEITDITMLPYIDAPYVTNSGTNTDPVFHLYIPRAATISSVEKTQIVGNVDTYTMTLQDGSTFNFTVTNGTGSGDMKAVDYDPQGTVSTAGGIIAYGDQRLEMGLVEGRGHTHGTQTSSNFMHIEGEGNSLNQGAKYSHVEGLGNTINSVDTVHCEGQNNVATGGSAPHVEGIGNTVYGDAAHVEGISNLANATYAHAEGNSTCAVARGAHAEGHASCASGVFSHAEGDSTDSTGPDSHAEGINSKASGNHTHAEGSATLAHGLASHAEGEGSYASGRSSHAEGHASYASGDSSHAEGANTTAIGDYSHAEGANTYAQGMYSHAEGEYTIARYYSHAEGSETSATGAYSHSEGFQCLAGGFNSHAEGSVSNAAGRYSHAGGGSCVSEGECSFAHGRYCQAINDYSAAFGNSGKTYQENTLISRARMFAVGNPVSDRTAFLNEMVVEHSDDAKSDIVLGENVFSVDFYGNTFMRGAPFTAKGVLYNRLIANGDYYVLEDGAAYVLWTNTRMINNNAWRGAQAYFIVSPFAPSSYGTGASTTALAVAQHHQFSSVGTAGLTLKKDTVAYYNQGTGTTCYHARIGIGSCVANCCVRYTLIKILGSELDMMSNYQ